MEPWMSCCCVRRRPGPPNSANGEIVKRPLIAVFFRALYFNWPSRRNKRKIEKKNDSRCVHLRCGPIGCWSHCAAVHSHWSICALSIDHDHTIIPYFAVFRVQNAIRAATVPRNRYDGWSTFATDKTTKPNDQRNSQCVIIGKQWKFLIYFSFAIIMTPER